MPAPNFDGLLVWFGAIVSVPLLLGLIATLLAALEGADATVTLGPFRKAIATAAGGMAGMVVQAGVVCSWVAAVSLLDAAIGIPIVLAGILVFWVLGGLTAYRTARWISERLNRYRCMTCGVRFRGRYPSDQCEVCAAVSDAERKIRVIAQFVDRSRESTG